MKPGPRPKPVDLKVLQGNPGHRRLRPPAVAPEPGAQCPKDLSAAARTEWKRLQPELERLGVLKRIDQAALAAYCEAWADFIWAVRTLEMDGRIAVAGNGTQIPHPAVAIKLRAMEKLRQFAIEFGFTPAAREGVAFPGSGDDADDTSRFFEPQGPRPVPPTAGRARKPTA